MKATKPAGKSVFWIIVFMIPPSFLPLSKSKPKSQSKSAFPVPGTTAPPLVPCFLPIRTSCIPDLPSFIEIEIAIEKKKTAFDFDTADGRAGKLSDRPVDKKNMYVNAQPPPVLTLAVQPEISIRSGTESQPLKLQPYQIVRAVVAEGGLEKVVLDVEQRKLEARTKVPLRTGQHLNLQVLGAKSPIHLRIMEEAELRHLFRLLHNLGDSTRLLPTIAKLHGRRGAEANGVRLPGGVSGFLESFMSLLRKAPARLAGGDIADLQKMLGLDLERLLAENKTALAKNTLKGALLMLSGFAGEKAGNHGARAQSLLEQLQLFALCRYRLGQENVQFLPLPLPFLETGYILAEKDGRGGGGDDDGEENGAWRMNIHLKLSRLGNLHVLLLFENDRDGNGRDGDCVALRLRVLCESDETVRIVSKALPSLADRLSTVKLAGYSVGGGAKDPVASLLKRLAPQGDHFLEVEV